jgi:predicted transcriptional regulator
MDLSQDGLALLFKDYEAEAMGILWNNGGRLSSRRVWEKVNESLTASTETRDGISRASIINFLNAMVDEGVLDYAETTGKGGHRRLYGPAMTEPQLWDHVTRITETKLAAVKGSL